jgi:MoxR-like ATPase
MGASPRATFALYRTSQALAAVEGRNYVIPDDVKYCAIPVFCHRIILNPESRLRGRKTDEAVEAVLQTIPAPVERSPM